MHRSKTNKAALFLLTRCHCRLSACYNRGKAYYQKCPPAYSTLILSIRYVYSLSHEEQTLYIPTTAWDVSKLILIRSRLVFLRKLAQSHKQH